MKTRRIVLQVAVMGIISVCFGGCIAAIAGGALAGAGTVAYISGALTARYSQDIDTVFDATKTSLEEMKIFVYESRHDALTGLITARDSVDDKITIKMKQTPEHLTEMSIRIGLFGDEAKSRLIYNHINRHLK